MQCSSNISPLLSSTSTENEGIFASTRNESHRCGAAVSNEEHAVGILDRALDGVSVLVFNRSKLLLPEMIRFSQRDHIG